ncbi:MAG: LysM peptidoglycan-binding domain-containing protein [Pikeienuella sp.]
MKPGPLIRAAALVAPFLAFMADGAEAAGRRGPIACGAPYTVLRGDTLQRIAERTYGPDASYRQVQEANRALIGRNPSAIEVGMRLNLPGPDGTGISPRAELAAPPAAATETTDGRRGPIACGAPYIVLRGDTLQRIAERTYGPDASYRRVRDANRALIGRNPSAIEVGMRLNLPCPETGADGIEAAAGSAPDTQLLILAGAGDAQGGLLAEILTTALNRIHFSGDYRIEFSGDSIENPGRGDGLSLAWRRPGCDWDETDAQRLCEGFSWSAPVLERVVSYYTRAADAPPADHRALMGKTICRPAGTSTFAMEKVALLPPNIELVRPATPADCFAMLLRGEADAAAMATTDADEALTGLARMDGADLIAEQPQLATITTLHAVAPTGDSGREADLALLDRGLRMIRQDGSWYDIIQKHLRAHAQRLMEED